MKLAERMSRIGTESAFDVLVRARALEAKGRSVIHLEHGRSFIIEAPGTSAANLYVQSAELNGRPIDRAWLTHEEVANGGRLVLRMGPRPSGWTTPPPPQVVRLAS